MSIDIPRYALLQPLGKGRFAEVWLAEHRLNKRRVAIKILNESRGDAFDPYAAFVREAEVLAGFDTPDIVRIYDNGPVDSRHYIVMEYVPGGTLETQMSHGPFEPARTIDCISRIALALDIAHQNGIVHRDLKPANVLMRDATTPVLTDFGISRVLQRTTVPGTSFAGTPLYMSPEQIAGETVDGRSDLYALGLILFELLVGSPPHGGSWNEIAVRRCVGGPTALPPAFAAFQAVLDRLLARQPHERYARGAHVARDLAAIRKGRRPPRRRTIVAAAAALAIVGAGIGVLWLDGPLVNVATTPADQAVRAPVEAPESADRSAVAAATRSSPPPSSTPAATTSPASTAAASPPPAQGLDARKDAKEDRPGIFSDLPSELFGPVLEPLTASEVERTGAVCPCRFWTEPQVEARQFGTPMLLWDRTREKVYIHENSALRTLDVRTATKKPEVLNPPEFADDLNYYEFYNDRLTANAIVRDTRCADNEPNCDVNIKSMRFEYRNSRGNRLMRLVGDCGCQP
ncbi:serine/threonine-protein kinase [Tahibacter soli]|uniref:Serine/threonine-protein kinase n=1 Tax=Tahibacter soli TaxID=2983605 RepID=A0A9X4BHU7_9GAMM|nr:serine/threonine-protein kinase [Tahibacter soli]MDC8014565.1 serine/threonine-protein kinase [Tahibacter soli]